MADDGTPWTCGWCRDVVENDDEVKLSNEALANAFDTDRLLAHRGRILDALEWRS